MAKLHNALATTELHNPKGMGVESATEIILTMSASLGAVSASASIVPHTADTYNFFCLDLSPKRPPLTISPISAEGSIVDQKAPTKINLKNVLVLGTLSTTKAVTINFHLKACRL